MSLKLFTSNRLENLSEALAETLIHPLSSPFDSEIIVVQSKGMERWISMELARKMGICSNIQFPFPNKFIYEIFQSIFPDLPVRSSFDREIMVWRIMKLLPFCIQQSQFNALRQYLSEPRSEIKKIQLSERIADLFDQYILFRPEMIFDWEAGKENHWQAELWREMVKGSNSKHRATLGRDLIKTLEKTKVKSESIPERIAVFGISALPKFHIQIFSALAKISEVNLFLMNPCREYWGDILSDAEIKIIERKKIPGTLDLFHIEKGNTILASMGKLGRDFFDLIEEWDTEEFSNYQDPGNDTLLSSIQSDILRLQDRSLTRERKRKIDLSDQTIQIHSCHSPRREMEILQNQLLELFEENPSLKPGDILVMAPDIEPYTPFIQSVFELPFNDPRRFPFSITDRSLSTENSIVNTFFAILDLPGSRFNAPQIFAILEYPAVRQKFNISDNDLSLVQSWIKETRIRWGRNTENRRDLGLPEFNQNSWQAGLNRLLLGYALPGQERNFYENELLPFDDVEGSQAVVLGNFLEFIEQLFETVDSLKIKRTLADWYQMLNEVLELFFATNDETVLDIHIIRRLIGEFEEYQDLSKFEDKIELEVIVHHLKTRLNNEGFGYGFMTGGVTFCSLLPMRSIPARVICLIGMNSDAYPRQNRQLGFDLLAKSPQKGDRSRRNDDRYLFLEAILSARDKLYISHIGQSIKDNSAIPPSVLVSELLDYIHSNFEIENCRIIDQIKTNHRLQAFSPEYFKRYNDLFSYSGDNLEIAKSLLDSQKEQPIFISEKLPEPDKKFKELRLQDLYRFFRNPTRFLLNKRLNLYLRENQVTIEEKETFALAGLDRYAVSQSLVKSSSKYDETRQIKKVTSSTGMLPIGAVGDYDFDRLNNKVRHFVSKTEEIFQLAPLDPVQVDLNINEFHVTGRLDHVHENGNVLFRYARVKAKDHLNAWLNHLVLNCYSSGNYPAHSFLAGVNNATDGQWVGWVFQPLQNSFDILSNLLDIYWEGLSYPIRFFPDSSYTYFRLIKEEQKTVETALENAQKTWFGTDRQRGEIEDVYFQLCFRNNEDPLSGDFEKLSQVVYEPLIDNREELL
ncbi:exodeoxyribonuclease V subunit gamma [candidate division KSB1 bacterium]|nr:exodeoxyribonuclease V subunit gamma [candidate division KSB1 bacterium]